MVEIYLREKYQNAGSIMNFLTLDAEVVYGLCHSNINRETDGVSVTAGAKRIDFNVEVEPSTAHDFLRIHHLKNREVLYALLQ